MAKRKDSMGSGPNQRQLRVGELIRRALSEVLSRGDIHDPDLAHVSITVGEVRMSNDLKLANAFVLPLGGQNSDVVLAALNRSRGEVRRQINKTVTLKFSPEIKFLLDQTFDQLDETRRLLGQDAVQKDLDT
jgi:ribosome-binding factor A